MRLHAGKFRAIFPVSHSDIFPSVSSPTLLDLAKYQFPTGYTQHTSPLPGEFGINLYM